MATLVYIVFMFPGTWHGSVALITTADQGRCEAVAKQLSKIGTNHEYRCETLVKP